jgi:hypothetical protein
MALNKLVAGTSASDPLASTGADVAAVVNGLSVDSIVKIANDAFSSNAKELPAMATPPAVTSDGTSAPVGQTKGYTLSALPNFFFRSGGTATTADRVYSSVIGATGGNIGTNNGREGTFSRYAFIADANKVTFRINGSTERYRFIVDGQYVSKTGTLTAGTATTPHQYITLDFTSAGGRREREIIIEMQKNQGFVGAYVGQTEKLFQSATPQIRTVALGDSYCLGSSATLLGDGVDAVMADYLGWSNHMNSGSGGTGWATTSSAYTFLQRIQNGDLGLNGGIPDIICLQGSINDKNAAAATVTANCLAGLQAARAYAPNALIFVFGVWPAAGGTNGTLSIADNEAAIGAAVTAFNDTRAWFIPINSAYGGAWLEGTGTTSSPTGTGNADAWMFDNSHLGDYGCLVAGKLKASSILSILRQNT